MLPIMSLSTSGKDQGFASMTSSLELLAIRRKKCHSKVGHLLDRHVVIEILQSLNCVLVLSEVYELDTEPSFLRLI